VVEFLKRLLLFASCCVVVICNIARAQTYEVNGPANAPAAAAQMPSSAKQNEANANQGDLGWGSNIEVAREARAAQDALKRNDYPAAINYAERAAKSASQNAELWFLLGYCARLGDRYQVSVDAYARGLKLRPNSSSGMAGLAQTYVKMGRDAEAQALLQKVVDANPKDANSLQLAGELMLSSDPNKALDMLRRADAIAPSAHTDLLIAHAFDRLNQPEESARYLNRAKAKAPKDPDVLRAVAGQYRDQGKYDEAIAALQSIPNRSTDAEAELAFTYQLAGRQEDAANLYSRLAKSAKGNIGLELSAAQALMALGQADAAQGFLDDARKIDGNNYRLHSLQGALDEAGDRLPEAASEYAAAISSLPARVPEGPLFPIELRLNLYELKLRQDDEAGAKQQLDAALGQINQVTVPESSRPEMLRLRAAIEAGLGNMDAANKDLRDALALAPTNVNSLLNYASLQWKLGQKEAAWATFTKVLEIDHNNRTALSSLGYLARDRGDAKLAEGYFARAIAAHPKDYAPYLALGDLYTSEKKFAEAQTNYEEAFKRNPGSALVVAGGAAAALESHHPELAKSWLDRAQGKMLDNPQVGRERERYLTLKGDYAEAAKAGYAVLEKLPNDREGVVYLAYDLYYSGRYAEARALVTKYEPIIKNDKDLPLIMGYLDARDGKKQEAVADFTRALERDPKMATGYVNRGFMLNDLKEPNKAAMDFHIAIQLQPEYGEAHLGLAYADLQLHRPQPALIQLNAVQKILGKTRTLHLAKAEAYRQEQDFAKAEPEFREALHEDPNDFSTQLEYADTLYRMRRFQSAIGALAIAEKLQPENPQLYALRAQVYAREGNKDLALRDVQTAEKFGNNDTAIFMATGAALLALGDRDAAMQRFSRALDVPGGDRIGVRLAIAEVFLRQGHYDDVRRQLTLGFSEARLSNSQVTADDILEAANIFLAMHDFELAETYFAKARMAGANNRTIEIGLANAYLAEGDTQKAQDALDTLGPATDYRDDYDYMMAAANVYRQRQDTVQALSTFAQASSVAGQEDTRSALTAQDELASEEGRQITRNLSVAPEASFAPSLEDINVYTLDAKILRVTNPALLPPPRHSFQSLGETHYRVHLGKWPAITGIVGESITDGTLLFPSVNVIQKRHTFDTFFNGGITPLLRFGANTIAFDGGLQFTIRRDTVSPVYMNQNLFRQFLYVSTSSFFNWVSINANAIHEAGPFTDQNLSSRDLSTSIEFTVGRPWGHTSLLTGYSARDLQFSPTIEEYFSTSSYAGIQHRFGSRITAAILAEDLRSWRVQGVQYAIAQAFLPGGRFEFRINPRWNVQGSFLLSRGSGYHEYDNAQSQFLVAYTRPWHGAIKDATGTVQPVAYPMRLSFGVQQQTFYNFDGTSKTTLLPVVHFNLF
jgi:tetratricopeptide (TPR) repeat protein